MAWPVSSIYQTIVVGSTQITKGFGDAMQNAIYRLYGGLRSVKSLTVDGTGDQDASGNTVGAATLNGASGDTSPCIDTTATPSALKLLWRIKITSGYHLRKYVSADEGGVLFAVGAYYNGTNFTGDAVSGGLLTSPAYFLAFVEGELLIKYQPIGGASPFTLGSLATLIRTTTGGNLTATGSLIANRGILSQGAYDITSAQDVVAARALEAQAARSSATPGTGQEVSAGRQYKDGIVLAWALCVVDGTPDLTLTRGYNIASVNRNSLGNYTVQLNFGAAHVIAPIVTPFSSGAECLTVDPDATDADTIKIKSFDMTGAASESAGFSLVVFGG